MADVNKADQTFPWEKSYPSNVDWNTRIDSSALYTVLDKAVERFPDKVCADFMVKTWTYSQIGSLVDRAAKGLQEKGVGRGDHVGLFLPNCPYYIIAYFAVLKIGATVVNYNPLYADREIRHQINDSETTIIVTLDLAALYGKVAPMLDDTGLKRIIIAPMTGILPFPKNFLFPWVKRREVAWNIPRDDRHWHWKALLSNDGRFTPPRISPDEVALLQYTGGTTGTPKGAMLSHANIVANVQQSVMWFDGAEEGREVMLGVLPFFHVFAMTVVMLLSISVGARIVMMPRFDLSECLRLIQKKHVTLFPAVPTIFSAINNYSKIDRFDLTSLKFCISGGAALPAEVNTNFERLTGCKLVEGYGLTESSPVVTANPLFGLNKAGSIGLPFPRTEVHILSLEDGRTPLAPNERGEVCVRGPQVMKGYYNQREETENTIVDGLLHTGDVGYMDDAGYTFIVDRIKDMIVTNGYNVYPRTVEEAVYLHPAVSEVIAAGIPDPRRGQSVKVFIKLAEGQTLTADELKTFLKDKLSPIEMPRQVEFRDELPKTMIGKLNRKAVLEEEKARSKKPE